VRLSCVCVDAVRIRLNCVGVFDVVSFDPNLQSGSTQMERYKVRLSSTFLLANFLAFSQPWMENWSGKKPIFRFLRATAGTAIARLSHRNSVRLSVRLSVCLSVCHTGGSGKNGAS